MIREKRGKSFIEGTMVLMLAGILVKVIGMFFAIPLTNIYGADGNGIFTQAYYIYMAAYIISTAGLPVAVSKMVAEASALGRYREAKRIFRLALAAFTVIGISFTVLIMLGARPLTIYFKSSMSYYAVLAIAPSIFFVSIISALRGFYQGLSNMVPTAVSQVIEALGKLGFGLGLAWYLMHAGYSLEIVVAGAIGGVTIGTALSMIYILIRRVMDRDLLPPNEAGDQTCPGSRELIKKLFTIAVPITVGASVLSLTSLIDMFVVMRRLQDTGMTYPAANYLYGAYAMAVKFFNVPQAMIVGIGISAIPAISAACAQKNGQRAVRLTETSLRLTGLLAFPCAVGMFVLAHPILDFFYYAQPDDVLVAFPLLIYLCPSIIFVSMVSVTNAILQANGKVSTPVYTMLAGGAVKLITNYMLVGMPGININGAPLGTLFCYSSITVLNFICIYKSNLRFSMTRSFVRPMLAATVMGCFAWLIYSPMSGMIGGKMAMVFTVSISGIFYLLMLIALKALPKEDICMLPRGEKIAKLLKIK